MSADYQLSFHDYLAIARRWTLAMMLTFGVVLAGAVVVALLLPRVYEASGTLLAEAPGITGELGRTGQSMNADQRVQAVSRRIMSRENLLDIAQKHGVFELAPGVEMKENDIVASMRNSIRINVLNSNGWERPSSNFAFVVAFQHGKPEKAFEVANALTQLFIESSVKQSVAQASRANEFLKQEAERVKSQLESLEVRIASYKRSQGGAVGGDGLALLHASIQSLESDLRQAERDHRAALNELKTLEVELAGARAGVLQPGVSTPSGPSTAEQELQRARTELARIRGIYTEDHPDVKNQQRQIELLERAVRSEASASSPAREAMAGQARLAISRLEAQIATARARADLLYDQQRNLRSSIAQQRSQIARAPQFDRDLSALERDRDAAKAQYEDLRSKQMSAQIVQNLEGDQQGERFSVFEPPLLPEYPIKPARKKIVAAGLAVALGAAVAMALLLETLFSRVRGVNALTSLTGSRPLAIIPYIRTPAEAAAAQANRKRVVLISIMSGVAVLAAIHVLIAPLPNLIVMLVSRLG